MNEVEIQRFINRSKRFVLEGLSEEESDILADKMFLRDKENDDRRVCFECENYNDKNTHCNVYFDSKGKTYRPLRFVIQRCDKFKLRKSK